MSTMTSTIPFFPANTITTFPTNPKTLILKNCKTRKHLNQIHAHLIKTRLLDSPSIAENLLESAAILLPENSMDYAVSIFRVLNEPNSSIYNLLIRGFTLKQTPFESIVYFKQMLEDFVEPDGFTYPCALKACSRLRALSEGEQIHAQVVKSGFGSDGFVQNTLIHFYANCGKIKVARKVFDEMSESEKTIYTWNSMLSGYTKSGFWEEGVSLFREMRDLNVQFNDVTLVSVLTACGRLADLELGEWIGDYIKVNGFEENSSLMTSLVDMYAKCGCLNIAKSIFDKMPRRDVVAWSAMISGYSQANLCREALNLFHEMQQSSVGPNEVTMVSVLSSCATLGALETGKWVHTYIKKKRLNLTVTLGTTLIEFYAKCGCIDDSIEVFNNMPSKNAWSWTVLIQGHANNGQAKRALKLFKAMQDKKIEPNDVTFISVLSACSHAGLVDEGRHFFANMTIYFGIEPRIEHYGIMVDILGRAGLIEEAYQFIQSMPIKPNDVIWRTLLASCKIHKNIEFGEESLKNIIGLDPAHSGDYILLSNIFASVGRWEDALKVRSNMKKQGIKKTPGCSMIEFDGRIHELFAEDNLHPCSKEIYNFVENMMNQIKLNGYVPNTDEARLDAEEPDRETSVSHHSEKLAIAFGLIKTSPGTTIRISKNLRVCIDCHNATKIISKVYDREIVVRDRNRFHHFKEGSCSCNDFCYVALMEN